MKTLQLGQTGLALSPLGLGTVKFGRNEGVKYPQKFDLPDETALTSLLGLAKDLGVNTLDTAPAYGESEERLGRLLRAQRSDWIIIGKAGEEFADGVSYYDFTPAAIRSSLLRSLKRLNTDYLDIFLIHSDGNDLANLSETLIDELQDIKKQGLVRAVGASIKTVEGGIHCLKYLDTVMATYTADYQGEKKVLDYAAKLGKGVLLKKALSSGHNTKVEEALRFCFSHKAVTSAIIGTLNEQHLQQNSTACLRALGEIRNQSNNQSQS